MNENKWLEGKLDAMDRKIDELKDLVKNHLEHHFFFTMGALAGVIAVAVALIALICK